MNARLPKQKYPEVLATLRDSATSINKPQQKEMILSFKGTFSAEESLCGLRNKKRFLGEKRASE